MDHYQPLSTPTAICVEYCSKMIARCRRSHQVNVGARIRELAQLLEGLLTSSIPHLNLNMALSWVIPFKDEVVEGCWLVFRLLIVPVDGLVRPLADQARLWWYTII